MIDFPRQPDRASVASQNQCHHLLDVTCQVRGKTASNNLTLMREISAKVPKDQPAERLRVQQAQAFCPRSNLPLRSHTSRFPWFWCVSPAILQRLLESLCLQQAARIDSKPFSMAHTAFHYQTIRISRGLPCA